jgi:hypothetical protein
MRWRVDPDWGGIASPCDDCSWNRDDSLSCRTDTRSDVDDVSLLSLILNPTEGTSRGEEDSSDAGEGPQTIDAVGDSINRERLSSDS